MESRIQVLSTTNDLSRAMLLMPRVVAKTAGNNIPTVAVLKDAGWGVIRPGYASLLRKDNDALPTADFAFMYD